jgi:hypothetical protein
VEHEGQLRKVQVNNKGGREGQRLTAAPSPFWASVEDKQLPRRKARWEGDSGSRREVLLRSHSLELLPRALSTVQERGGRTTPAVTRGRRVKSQWLQEKPNPSRS